MSPAGRRTIPLDPRPGFSAYHLLTSLVVPRPIAWVSTRSPAGVDNLAPFSYFQAISSAPPVLMISIGTRKAKRDERKDTLVNIEATGEFVVNLVPEALGASMARSAAELPADESEFELLGLTKFPAQQVGASCVADSPVNIECRLLQSLPVGDAVVVFGTLLVVHAREELITERGLIDADRLRPLGRLSESWYAAYGGKFKLDRG